MRKRSFSLNYQQRDCVYSNERLSERDHDHSKLRALWARQWAAWIRKPLNLWRKVTSDAILADLELKARRRRRRRWTRR